MSMDGKRVALALGSGGARGYAHIGVIDALHERDYEIVGVAGSSMGALVGGMLAAGALDEYTAWAKTLSQRAVLRLLDPAWTGAGVLRAEKVLDVVRELLGDATIEDLAIPYTAVATDLITGKAVWLQRGPVDAAIRASIAIPGMISPHILDGRVLADGGILDPLPVLPLAGARADLTIAVSLIGEDPEARRFERPDAEPRAAAEWLNRLLRNTSALFNRLGTATDPDTPVGDDDADDDIATATAMVPKLGSFELVNRTFDVMQSALARHLLSVYPPDLLIEVPRTTIRSLDFHRAAEAIEIGHQIAVRAIEEYERGTTQAVMAVE